MKYTRIGDLLVSSGLITEDQLKQGLALQKGSNKRLGAVLIDNGFITEKQLMDALRIHLGVDSIDLTETEISPEMTRLLPKRLAKKYSVVPVKTLGNDLYLAMADPLNFIAIEEVKKATKKKVVPLIATTSSIDRTLSTLYGTEGAKRAIREMQLESDTEEAVVSAFSSQIGDDAAVAAGAPSIRLVDSIIERGVNDKASDIHIEPQEDEVIVRERIDGILHETLSIPKELQSSVISRIKVMCNMDVTERRTPQDARAIVHVRVKEIDLRVSTLPTVHGEKIVMRILDRDNVVMTAEGLGFEGESLALYNKLLQNRQGVVLIVGPTGSGKSSTMYTMVQKLNTESVNLVTLEDPVEYNTDGVSQVQIDPKVGMTFSRGLRAIMRQDPDIIAVGEIRDGETAEIAMRAAITGHLVLSTIHTGSALSTLDRLGDVGVEPFMIANALKGVISQRLVRCICPHCKKEYMPSPEELDFFGLDHSRTDLRFYKGEGCSECFNSGYRERTAIMETLMIDEELKDAIYHQRPEDELADIAYRNGFKPIESNCLDLVLAGKTTVAEAIRTINTTV